MNRLQAEWFGVWIQACARNLLYWLWGTASLLFSCWRFFPWEWSSQCWMLKTHLYLVLRFRIGGSVPSVPSYHVQRQYCLFSTRITIAELWYNISITIYRSLWNIFRNETHVYPPPHVLPFCTKITMVGILILATPR